jgi:hypothetical protein
MSYFSSLGSILTQVGNIVLDEVDKVLDDQLEEGKQTNVPDQESGPEDKSENLDSQIDHSLSEIDLNSVNSEIEKPDPDSIKFQQTSNFQFHLEESAGKPVLSDEFGEVMSADSPVDSSEHENRLLSKKLFFSPSRDKLNPFTTSIHFVDDPNQKLQETIDMLKNEIIKKDNIALDASNQIIVLTKQNEFYQNKLQECLELNKTKEDQINLLKNECNLIRKQLDTEKISSSTRINELLKGFDKQLMEKDTLIQSLMKDLNEAKHQIASRNNPLEVVNSFTHQFQEEKFDQVSLDSSKPISQDREEIIQALNSKLSEQDSHLKVKMELGQNLQQELDRVNQELKHCKVSLAEHVDNYKVLEDLLWKSKAENSEIINAREADTKLINNLKDTCTSAQSELKKLENTLQLKSLAETDQLVNHQNEINSYMNALSKIMNSVRKLLNSNQEYVPIHPLEDCTAAIIDKIESYVAKCRYDQQLSENEINRLKSIHQVRTNK